MVRAATIALCLLALAACATVPGARTAQGPEILDGARYVGETWCSDSDRGSRAVWLCRVYDKGGRVIVGFYDALTGKLLALAERIGDGPQVRIFWKLQEAADSGKTLDL